MVRRILVFVILLVMAFPFMAAAKQVGSEVKFKHADRNKDGVIDRKEMHMEKEWEHRQRVREAEAGGNVTQTENELRHRQRSRVNTWWEKRADTNNDGVVDSNELSAWKKLEKERIDLNNDGVIDAKERRLCWRHARSKVNKPIEAKYDKNSNGWLEPDEVKAMLRDKQQMIKTGGKAKVDTAVEEEYDKNKDGVIDANEAGDLKEDLKD